MNSPTSVLVALLLLAPSAAPTGYPKGVEQAGLQAVYDARPGPMRPFARAMNGATLKTFADIGGGGLGWKGGGRLADLDASGTDLYFNDGDFTLDNFKSSSRTGGFYRLAVGHVNGGGKPARLTLRNALIDQADSQSDRGSIVVGPGSRFDATKVSFLHASGTNLNLLGDSSLTDVYFDSPGQNPTPDAHTEGPHYFQGSHTVLRTFFDSRGRQPGSAKATGLVYVEAANGSVDVSIKDSILAGAADLGIASPIQAFARKPGLTVSLKMDNVVLQAGRSSGAAQRYVVIGPNVSVTCHNCRDYDTGKVIDDLINKMKP